MDSASPPPVRARLQSVVAPALLAAGMCALYFAFAQRNLTFDGAMFLTAFTDREYQPHPHHPLFGRVLRGAVAAGEAAGLSAWRAGAAQAACFAALAGLCFHGLLRRAGVSPAVALGFQFLFCFNAPVLVNATSVELYAAALFATTLSARAFAREARRPSVAGAAVLFATSLAVVALHVGFAFWVLATYLALAAGDRGVARRVLRVAEGAAVAGCVVAWIALEGALHAETAKKTTSFLAEFWTFDSIGGAVRRVFEAPLFFFASQVGLLAIAAPFGLASAARDRAPEARLAILATLLFFGFYSFWTPDEGGFFLPLLPVWGLFGAIGVDRALRSGRREFAIAIAVAWVYGLLFLVAARSVPPEDSATRLALAGGWIAFAVASARLGRFPRPSSGRPMDNMDFMDDLDCTDDLDFGRASTEVEPASGACSRGAAPSAARVAGWTASAVALSVAAFSFRLVEFRRPDDATAKLEAFLAISPPGARLVADVPGLRARFQAEGRETLPALEEWDDAEGMTRKRATLARWLQESVGPRGVPLYFDEACRRAIRFVWGRYGEPPWIDIPYEKFDFREETARGALLFRAVWDPYRDEKEAARRYEPYRAEKWGEESVAWTRREVRLRLEVPPGTKRIRVRYWVGHGNVAPENPVAVRARIGEGPAVEAIHGEVGFHETVVELPEPDAHGVSPNPTELRVETEPFWLAPDGRELGVALYTPLPEGDAPGGANGG